MSKLLLSLLMLLTMSISACSKSDDIELPTDNEQTGGNEDDNEDNDQPPLGGNGRYLVLYASRSGNTESVAQLIQSSLDCDILEVEPTIAYESDYNAMLTRAQREQQEIDQGNYPSIKTSVDSFDNYDMIFVGYPIWYGHMATPMQTFLHRHAEKLKGKSIALFATSGSSVISTSVSEAQRLCAESIFTPTLHFTSSTISQMQSRVAEWLSTIGTEKEQPNSNSMKIKLTVGDRSATATMVDNPTTRDFLSRLPLTITMTDYANAEKIYTFSPTLTTQGTTLGHSNPQRGDIDLYVPWGNVAIFYKVVNGNSQLVNLGHIDGDGIDLFDVSGNVNVTIEQQ